jgi:hypothetical protein
MARLSTTSLSSIADWARGQDESDAYRAILGFVDEVSAMSNAELLRTINDEPPAAGDDRVDALLAAVAEHLACDRQLPAPAWCSKPGRFLTTAWFPVDLPSVRVRALVSAPAAFWRRLIFIDRSDLSRV